VVGDGLRIGRLAQRASPGNQSPLVQTATPPSTKTPWIEPSDFSAITNVPRHEMLEETDAIEDPKAIA